MNPAAKWVKAKYGQRMEIPSGTNVQSLFVFKIILAVFELGLRVVLAALQDDPGFGLREKVGAFKIVAPLEWRETNSNFWKPEQLRNEDDSGPFRLTSARREKLEYVPCADGSPGRCIVRANDVVPDLTIAEFRKLSEKIPALTESTFKWELTEANLRKFDPFDLIMARNRKLEQQHKPLPVYAQDQDATLFRANAPGINLLKTTDETFLKKLLAAGCLGAEGVTSPYLYFGMSGTTFATHLEDVNLCSISYNHSGAAKVWFIVSPDYRREVQALADRVLQEAEKNGCHAPLRHKHVILPPTLLTANSIPYTVVIQAAGEYVFTEAGSYHFGFYTGFNIAEAVNYATEAWLEEGIRSYGGFYDTQAPMMTDVGELCCCDHRFKFAPVVRFENFPASEVCKLFHLRQRWFCALKKYADACVDLLRAGDIEPPSVDLISEAVQRVRITGPGAEPNPLREPLVFGTQQPSSAGNLPVAAKRLSLTGRVMCHTLPCCKKCLKSFSYNKARDAHESRCKVTGVVPRVEATDTASSSTVTAGSSKVATGKVVVQRSSVSANEAPFAEGSSQREAVSSQVLRRRHAYISSSSSSSVSATDCELGSPPKRKQPKVSSLRGHLTEHGDVTHTARGRGENAETVSSTSNGDDGSLPAMFRQFVTSFTGLVDSLKVSVAADPAQSIAVAPEPAVIPQPPSSSSGLSSSDLRSRGSRVKTLYPCSYCGKRYTMGNLTRHLLSHRGRFRCHSASCGMSFSYNSDRTRHYKNRHPGEEAPPKDDVFEPFEPNTSA